MAVEVKFQSVCSLWRQLIAHRTNICALHLLHGLDDFVLLQCAKVCLPLATWQRSALLLWTNCQYINPFAFHCHVPWLHDFSKNRSVQKQISTNAGIDLSGFWAYIPCFRTSNPQASIAVELKSTFTTWSSAARQRGCLASQMPKTSKNIRIKMFNLLSFRDLLALGSGVTHLATSIPRVDVPQPRCNAFRSFAAQRKCSQKIQTTDARNSTNP